MTKGGSGGSNSYIAFLEITLNIWEPAFCSAPGDQHKKNNPKKNLKKNRNSLLNLHFKAPQALGPFQIDRACKKIPTCKICWVFVQYTSRKSQNTSQIFYFFLWFLTFWSISASYPSNSLPTIVKSFQDNLFHHKIHTEHILYGYMSRNISSGNLLFVNFSEPRIEENKALVI